MVPVVLTLHAGEEDHEYGLAQEGARGTVALRRRQVVRRAKRVKTDRLEAGKLATMLVRYRLGGVLAIGTPVVSGETDLGGPGML